MRELTMINRPDKCVHTRWATRAFILCFGAYGETRLLVYARHLEDALDECVDWIAENAPGLLMNDQVAEAYHEAIAEGKSEEEAIEEAECDMTIAGNAGDYIASWEWGIVGEDLTPKQIADYVHER